MHQHGSTDEAPRESLLQEYRDTIQILSESLDMSEEIRACEARKSSLALQQTHMDYLTQMHRRETTLKSQLDQMGPALDRLKTRVAHLKTAKRPMGNGDIDRLETLIDQVRTAVAAVEDKIEQNAQDIKALKKKVPLFGEARDGSCPTKWCSWA